MSKSSAQPERTAFLLLIILIALLSSWASYAGIFSTEPKGVAEFTSIYGETIKLQGNGLYYRDSVSAAAQGIGQDYFTLFVAVPLLLIAAYFNFKGLLRGRVAVTGLLGYFLYTYLSYAMLWQYNSFFLIYVVLMSASFYAFVLSALQLDRELLKQSYRKSLPIKWIGGFQIFIGVMISLLWFGRIVGAGGYAPVGLEHYTTLVIQAMDLGIVVPTALLSGTLLIKRSSWGYWLSSIVIFKGSAMLLAIMGMILNQYLHHVPMSVVEIGLFSTFTILCLSCLSLLLFQLDEPKKF